MAIEIIEVPCPLCGHDKKSSIRSNLKDVEDRIEGIYGISQCLNCGMQFLSPTPSPSSLPECYPINYHVRTNRKLSTFTRSLYRQREKLRFRRIQKLTGKTPSVLLDVGCGSASLLSTIEEHWGPKVKLFGQDLDFEQIDLGADSKVTLLKGPIGAVQLPASIDVVILYEVLEHLPNPIDILRLLYPHLRSGGRVVGTVPWAGSFWHKIFPNHWAGLQVPRHQMFFRPLTLIALFKKAGFRVRKITPVFEPGDFAMSFCIFFADSFATKTLPRKMWFFLPLMLLSLPIMFIQVFIFRSSGTMEFIAEKP